MSLQIGLAAEAAASEYLVAQGLICVTHNYRSRMGEIDLIMQDGEYLVFVEVRARISAQFGGALGSITKSKQQKIIKTALFYLSANKRERNRPIRFDVLSIDGNPPVIAWIKNAFGVDY